MNRPTFFGLAFAATALLLVSASGARANTTSAVSTEGVAPAETPTATVQPPPTTPAVPAPTAPTGGTTSGTTTTPAATTPATGQTTTTAPATSQATAPATSQATANATPPTATELVQATTPSGSGTQSGVAVNAVKATGTQADVPSAGRITASAPPSAPIAPSAAPSGQDYPASTITGQSGVILERALPAVERRLRGVQTQMDDLQRRLAGGGSASSQSLVRLRRSLELIAPALVAIGVQVDDAGPLSPHLQNLLNRVNTRLDGAHRSAAALADALRASGVSGPELDLLLRELQSFQAVSPAFLSSDQLTAQATVYAAQVAYTQAPPAAASAAAPATPTHQAARPETAAATSGATTSQQPAAPDELIQQVAASGSASAGPGGAFSAAGLAALAALLGVLALPRLLSRVQLAPMRCYAAIFLVPLQRPG